MKILAIDTSSSRCSVTIYEDNNVLINLFNDEQKTHSVKLMPMIDESFKKTGLTLDDIGLLVCSTGPGSFTGVRIGIATVKAFADVKHIPIVGVCSLESLAYNVSDLIQSDSLVCSLVDAKNKNVYCGIYCFENNECNQLVIFSEDLNTTISLINEKLKELQLNKIYFVGDASKTYKDTLTSSFTNSKFASDEENMQNGISLAKAGLQKFNSGDYGNSNSIFPIYLRKSQAERVLEKKIKILPMTSDNIESISPNFKSEFDEFWNINTLKNDFSNTNSKYFVAKLDDEIVGFAGFLKICDEANIMNIVTKVNRRHLGVGTKLLEALISSARDLKCTSITLEVNEHNIYAIKLYEKFNFNRIGLRKKYYNNTDDAILMSVKL